MTAASGAPDDRTIDSSPAEVAEAWIADDPDPRGRAELRALLDAGNHRELADRFRGSLHFGTAGLRGSLGAGPTRMNMFPAQPRRGSWSATTPVTAPSASPTKPPE
jgi:phosphomannomutase